MSTERKVSISHLSNGFELINTLTAVVTQHSPEDCQMSVQELPSINVKGEAFPLVMQDLKDSLIAAFENGDPEVAKWVKKVEIVDTLPVPSQEQLKKALSTPVAIPKTVYVLINKDSTLEGVVTDARMAKRFEKWSGGSIEECQLDELKDA